VQHLGLSGVILPDADAPGRRAVIEATLRRCGAVIGSNVPLDQLPASVRVTEAAVRLASSGVLRDDPLFVADHYDTVMVARDPWLLEQLRRQVLAPLDAASPRVRQRLEETLFAWLNATSDQQAAEVLHVHPQTIRYRVRQLREVFGATLDDPESRRRLVLALAPTATSRSSAR
jgi:DNA-binding PucR family transcriptional regulator